MVAFTTTELKLRKNLVSSRLAIVRTTVGGAQPPGFTTMKVHLIIVNNFFQRLTISCINNSTGNVISS